MKKPIPILGLGAQSRSNSVTAQRRLNCYVDQSDDKGSIVAYGLPGLTGWFYSGASPIRGIYPLGDYIYIVTNNSVSRININTMVQTVLGTISTSTGFVSIADNGLQVMFVDGSNGYIFTLATLAFVQITDVDFPVAPVTVVFQDSFFIVNDGGTKRVQWSSSYNGLAWNALDVIAKESFSDNVVRVASNGGYLYLLGENSVEAAAGNPATGAYQRISGLTVEHGLAAVQSLAKINDQLCFLSVNRRGECAVSILSGGSISHVSTSDIDNILNSYTTVSNATAFSYSLNGHEMYQINFPTANASWLYDATMQIWSEVESGGGRHLADRAAMVINSAYVASYTDGWIYFLDKNSYSDNGQAIAFELVGKHLFNNLERIALKEIQIDCETGGTLLASGQGSDPQINIGISNDGGRTWRDSFVTMGKIGEYTARARRYRLGTARDWMFRIRITDPVKRVITGAYVDAG
ncbi:MAG: packaged DNA stabilization protein [Patescibacteria group bacterium]